MSDAIAPVTLAKGSALNYKGKNYFLAIAINDYEHLPPLRNCIKDVSSVVKVLTEDFEFERENTKVVCSGAYPKSLADVVVKPSPIREKNDRRIELEALIEQFETLPPATLKSKAARDILKIWQEKIIQLKQSPSPLEGQEGRKKFISQLGAQLPILESLLNDETRSLLDPFLVSYRRLIRHLTFVQEPATREVFFRELRRTSKQIAADIKEDPELRVNLILYYSGHGWYDEFLDQGYWIPVNSEEDDYSKYISNGTIRDFLNSMQTHHTFLISDSCFSGSLFATGEGKSIASTRLEKDPSRWGLTAGRNEVVSDGEAGSNSPFATNLIEELQKSDVIGVQELSTKVLETVAANAKQTPRGEPLRIKGHKGGQFIFRKKKNARKFWEAGMLLMEMAEYQPEHERFKAAAFQFHWALRLARKATDKVTFSVWRARALTRAGLLKEARETLQENLDKYPDEPGSYALAEQLLLVNFFEIGVQLPQEKQQALLKQSTQLIERWKDKLQAPFIQSIATSLKQIDRKIYVLSIGVDEYSDPNIPGLNSTLNDVALLSKVLPRFFEQSEVKIQTLTNQEATYAAAIKALKGYQDILRPEDVFIFTFSGHAIQQPDSGETDCPFLVMHDTGRAEYLPSLQAGELHEWMEKLPCETKMVILDTDGNEVFSRIVQQPSYALLHAASNLQNAFETRINNQTYGAFTAALCHFLSEPLIWKDQRQGILDRISKSSPNQTPRIQSDREFFNSIFQLPNLQYFLGAILGPAHMKNQTQVGSLYHQIEFPLPDALKQRLANMLARLGMGKEAHELYAESLPKVGPSRPPEDWDWPLLPTWDLQVKLAEAALADGDLKAALEHIAKSRDALAEGNFPPRIPSLLNDLQKKIEAAPKADAFALIVGLDHYEDHPDAVKSAVKDSENWQAFLHKKGYKKANIKVLHNQNATRKKFLAAFEKLAQKAMQHPCFFFFAGVGTDNDVGNKKGLMLYDSFTDEENPFPVFLSELADLSKETNHLQVVLDAGFSARGERFVEMMNESEVDGLGYGVKDTPPLPPPQVGNYYLIPGAKEENATETWPECYENMNGGMFSQHLLRILETETQVPLHELMALITKDPVHL